MCNVTPFRVANQPLPITPFRVHFWGWLTSMSSSIICEWPPREHKYLTQGHKHVGTSGARTHGLVILSPAIELIYWDVAALRYVFFTQQGQALWQIDLWWNFTIFFSFIFSVHKNNLFFFCTLNSNVRFLILLVCFLFCFCFLVFVYIFIYLLILYFNFL